MNPKCKNALQYNPHETPADITRMLETLGEFYPISTVHQSDAIALEFVICQTPDSDQQRFEIYRKGDTATITAGNLAALGRAACYLMSGLVAPGQTIRESHSFKHLGIMIDCARNAIMKISHLKKWLCCLSLMGFNTAYIYLEDNYELPGEEYFGYLRGRYSAAELQEADEFAASLGIELVGCIQTLGHLEQILKWQAYGQIKDTESVMLIDEPKTYELIEKMIEFFASSFRSKRIHVGMDEAWGLGRGQFMDRNGAQDSFEIMNRHLSKVGEICEAKGLAPMIWSDMYFRMATTENNYYDASATFSDEVKNAIPKNVQLTYWDYYNPTEKNYLDKIAAHENLHGKPVVASGCWTWGGLVWYGRDNTENNAAPCIRASKQAGIDELFFTMWGDDGAYCEYDSALAGLAFCADVAWAGEACTERLQATFKTTTGICYKTVCEVADINKFCAAADTIWDDPMQQMYWKSQPLREDRTPDVWQKALANYSDILEKLAPVADVCEPVDYAHLNAILKLAAAKIELFFKLDKAYPARDKTALQEIIDTVPQLIELTDDVAKSFRRQWYRRNKPYGFEVLQIRFGTLKIRFEELAMRLTELLTGKIENIPEFEERPTFFSEGFCSWGGWQSRASASIIGKNP